MTRTLACCGLLAGCGYSTYYPVPPGLVDDDTGLVDTTSVLPPDTVIPCGTADGVPATLRVTSITARVLQLWQVDPASCTEQFVVQLAGGGAVDLPTATGLTFTARWSTGELLAVFEVPEGAAFSEVLVP